MNQFKIEKDVPIPPAPDPKPERYPFEEMEVGDSFLVECYPGMEKVYRSTLELAGTDWAIRHGSEAEFTAGEAEGGVRVWRVK